MDSEQRKILFRIILSSLILIVINFVNVSGVSKLILFLIPYFIIGYDILLEAVEGIKEREIFDENFLMSIASIGALCLAFFYDGDYNEAIAVLILYQTGEFFSDYAADKSRKNILDLMDIRPDYANVEVEGKITKFNPAEIAIGTEILIKPGEKIPLDGIIVEGNSSLDMKALTGESLPKSVNINDEVLSGSINLSGVLKVKTTRKFA
ncbi:MAG: heavy metal translocating P-type ATPase, partial [Synergistaceae bacterium]|nr:heavy metal translocating P-type ATPase [Synergistaceae bacterium]